MLVTRRKCITLASVPVLGGLAAYVAGERVLGPDDTHPRFAPAASPRALLQARHLPNVPLVTHLGDEVRFYDDLVKDKKVVVTFVSSLDTRASRKVTSNLATIQRFFGDRLGNDIFLYSITRTPERDTPAVLERWAARSGAGIGWRFLTGDPAHVERIRHGLGFVAEDPAEDVEPAYSIALLRYGVEPEMRWGHCQALAPARMIAHSLLMDFGPGPVDPSAGVAWNVSGETGGGSAPIWNCRLLAKQV